MCSPYITIAKAESQQSGRQWLEKQWFEMFYCYILSSKVRSFWCSQFSVAIRCWRFFSVHSCVGCARRGLELIARCGTRRRRQPLLQLQQPGKMESLAPGIFENSNPQDYILQIYSNIPKYERIPIHKQGARVCGMLLGYAGIFLEVCFRDRHFWGLEILVVDDR